MVLLLSPVSRAAEPPIELRTAFGVNEFAGYGPAFLTELKILETFQERHPHIRPVSSQGLQISGAQQDMLPLLQIASNIAPDIMQISFARSGTYITNRFLYPLEKYLENSLGTEIPDGHLLSTDDYFARLKTLPGYDRCLIGDRLPRTLWPIVRRECPHGEQCPYLSDPTAHHYHIWTFPQSTSVSALFYRKDIFNEVGLPDRVPATLEEFYDWAKRLTNPPEDRYGLGFNADNTASMLSVGTLSFLYAYGGRLVEQGADGEWRCVFDSEEAVNAYHFVARLFREPFENKYGRFSSVIVEQRQGANLKVGMYLAGIDERLFHTFIDPAQVGFGPIPPGPTGLQGAHFGSTMTGIYAGLDHDELRRDAAWKFIFFFDGPEARNIRTQIYVENGAAHFLSAKYLNSAGYSDFAQLIPKGWEETRDAILEHGTPQPYGHNCQPVYIYVNQTIDQIINDREVIAAVQRFDEVAAKDRIRVILKQRVAASNERMLGIIPPEVRRFRNTVAIFVAIGIFSAFAFLFYKVFQAFSRTQPHTVHASRRGHWQFERYKTAYICLFPALGSIALWAYYPLIRGTTIAFQNYNVRGFSTWVGIDNFANVLFDPVFYYALWTSIKYCFLFITFGFFTPIVLAFLLTEVPRGKIVYRTLYYLPAVLSGAVVMFLWKDFYSSYGLLNQFLNAIIHVLNWLPGVAIESIRIVWLDNANAALLCIVLPIVWAGTGPGCLIYLAALKTVPDEFYEAAEIDGAGIWHKLRHVSIPGIKALIAINFIGAIIGSFHGGSEMVLAMTGGGPYQPYGSTEVIGLHIFWQTFGALRFGPGAAMAWVLGSMLIGFTVMRLTRLSRMEFRAAGATDTSGRK